MLLLSPILSVSLESNIVNTVKLLIRCLNAKVSITSIKQKLQEHPDYPSLLCISDVLSNWNISNVSFKSEKDTLKTLEPPFIVQIKEGHQSFFSIVKATDAEGLVLSDNFSTKWHKISWGNFIKKWTNIVTVVETGSSTGEESYEQNIKNEAIQRTVYSLGIGILSSLVFYVCYSLIVSSGLRAWTGILFLLLKVFGTYVTSLLLWYDVDKNNLIIQKVCKADKATNCNAILQSKASKVFGLISWGEIGFVYFLGGTLFLIFNSLNSTSITIISLLSLLAIPYTFFSIIYQWRVAKQWCVICITVQVILLLEVLSGLIGDVYTIDIFSQISITNIIMIFLIFTSVTIIWFILKPLLQSSIENRKTKYLFTRLKHNGQIFDSQLSRQRKVIEDNNFIGLTLGNPNAKNKLIKVCSPYCDPCAKAHPEIHQLLKGTPDLKVQIIFAATSSDKDRKGPPVRHFLAIKEQYQEAELDKALSEWYLAKDKDYDMFSKKYPIIGELSQYNTKLDDMTKWCVANDITYTPTFFINGYELPEMYNIKDLKHMIN
ncbi:MAG TPA: vitamin K epoxide reductase family protein [Sediminibacterium sp.]|nr:vitamin K epoxide reductase family protein [Sediminibacterium sp.]